MAIRLTIEDLENPGDLYIRHFMQDMVIVGRSRSCDVCLPSMSVSTRQFEIRLEKNDYKAVDLGSLNGTRINGKRLISHRPKVLHNADIIEIAGYKLSFRLGVSVGPVSGRAESTNQARQMLSSVLSGVDYGDFPSVLLVLSGPGKASRYECPKPPATLRIGRGRSMEIKLEDRDVSREHVEVTCRQGNILLRDLGSKKGIVVDGETVESATISPGQTFVVGNTTLALEHPMDGALLSIQDAPEEATSSFCPKNVIEKETFVAEKPPREEVSSRVIEEPKRVEKPVIVGPEDPMFDNEQRRTTQEIPRMQVQEGNDIGLIVVGVIIVAAAVIGLVMLFA